MANPTSARGKTLSRRTRVGRPPRAQASLGSGARLNERPLWNNVRRGFVVTDAGDPVAGVTIKVDSRTLHANATGRAAVDLPRGRFRAVAVKAGYVSRSAIHVPVGAPERAPGRLSARAVAVAVRIDRT